MTDSVFWCHLVSGGENGVSESCLFDGDHNELNMELASNLIYMMSSWVTSTMSHDLCWKSLYCLISGGSVTVSMETDVTQGAQPFKLIGFGINTRKCNYFSISTQIKSLQKRNELIQK